MVIAVAKAVGGVFAGSPALLSEAAHSVADSLNEIFLPAALRRSRRPADRRHPFGYGKERFFWSLLAAVGIFVMGGFFSFFQGFEALRSGTEEKPGGYVAGMIVPGVELVAEGSSLVHVAYRLGRDARDSLIGEAADPELSHGIRALLQAQPEIDSVEALFTMKTGLDSTLVADRIDLVPGLDSEGVEEVAVRIKNSPADWFPVAGQVFLDVTDRPAGEAWGSPAATGERGGA
ncbi:cation diffusion facilitator family transporter [Streptomyces griseochromogenes]|uniref:Cation efflux protein transmembrane domain-containing protein n=1 Tax=Streptomyces griseochromogenes TaxID=68214 RepID=A0A1B1AX56_9ACTN|nr:cation diffusion facilitator family transporter [Streptomyces griseochromogenes]ANP51164.1 hypothetical protein AVL59_17430 [Streptomyces griseochromogenes]